MNLNTGQRRMRLLLAVAVLACGLALVMPALAHAGWPLRDGRAVTLGFGAVYRAAEATASSTHRGIDISAESGAGVIAPLAGTVTFAGRVPAVGGGTVRGVTIATASGSVTLLPLSSISAAKGDALAEGDSVGVLAESGDGSSASTHLHVGVKRGDLYVDPLSVLSLPVVTPRAGGTGVQVPAVAQEGAGTRAGAAARTPSREHGSAGARVPSRVPASAGAPAPMRVAVPGQAVAPGVSVAGVSAGGTDVAAAPSVAMAGSRSIAAAPHPHAPAAPAAPTFAEVAKRFGYFVFSATKAASLGLLAALLAVGALWPLWRRGTRKGSGEVRVSALDDDVAAAVGR